MDDFTYRILQELRLIISLKLLQSDINTGKIYREIAKARTPEMLLKAVMKLPEEEIKNIQKILDGEEKRIASKPLKYKKNKNTIPAFSFKLSKYDDFKGKQRLETLDRIKKNKLGK